MDPATTPNLLRDAHATMTTEQRAVSLAADEADARTAADTSPPRPGIWHGHFMEALSEAGFVVTPKPDLPTDEDGHIQTSASYGEAWIVKIEWSTDFDGREIDPAKEEYAVTYHGDFTSQEEAAEWMDAYPEDTDIHDMTVILMNRVRPR